MSLSERHESKSALVGECAVGNAATRLACEAYDWAQAYPKTTVAIGLVATAAVAKFVGPKILDQFEGRKILLEASKLVENASYSKVSTASGLVKTYGDGSKIWFSEQRQRFGVKLAEQNGGSDLGQKLSELAKIGNRNTPLVSLRSFDFQLSEARRVDHVKRILFDAKTEEIMEHVPLHSTFVNTGNEALVLKTKQGDALRIQFAGRTQRVVDVDVLQPSKAHHGSSWQVEELPFVSSKGITRVEVDGATERVKSRGFLVVDYHPFNLGRTSDGRVVFVDPGCVFKPF